MPLSRQHRFSQYWAFIRVKIFNWHRHCEKVGRSFPLQSQDHLNHTNQPLPATKFPQRSKFRFKKMANPPNQVITSMLDSARYMIVLSTWHQGIILKLAKKRSQLTTTLLYQIRNPKKMRSNTYNRLLRYGGVADCRMRKGEHLLRTLRLKRTRREESCDN